MIIEIVYSQSTREIMFDASANVVNEKHNYRNTFKTTTYKTMLIQESRYD